MFVFLLGGGLYSATFAQAVVQLNPETIARRDRITLGDISQIRAGDPNEAGRLRAISLGYAPNVGAIREVTREKISIAIAAAGFEQNAFRIDGALSAVVRRAAQSIDPLIVRAAVAKVALTELESIGAIGKLIRLDLPAQIEAPTGNVEVKASMVGVRDPFSPFIVSVELRIDGRVVRRLSLTAQVEAVASVLVARHDLAATTRIREEDVQFEERKLDRAPTGYIRDLRQIRGVAARRAIAAGESISLDSLSNEIIVKSGDSVLITVESGALRIVVAGEARGSGRVGDRIQVKNIQSGALLQAIIEDEGLVSVRM